MSDSFASLAALPDIQFTDKSAEEIKEEIISGYEAVSGKTLYPGHPVRLFLETIAYIIVHQRNLIDYTGKMNLLAYASGGFLEHIGALVGVSRLPAWAAMTTVRFTLSASRAYTIVIPAGIRVTAGDEVYFATLVPVEIPAGETTAEVEARCLELGAVGNGYLPGQLKTLVDPLSWVESVENVTTTEGGTDVEDDESLRARIQLAPERFSVAGPKGAYRYWAKTAHPGIVDVEVLGPEDGTEPGNVEIYPLMEGGGLPSQEVVDLVYDICSAEDVRPDTDHVFVLPPETVAFDLSVSYWIDRSRATQATAIQAAVERAVNEWVLWQRSKLGRDLNPSELNHRMVAAGAKRTEIASPEFAVLAKSQVALARDATVSYGGLEDG